MKSRLCIALLLALSFVAPLFAEDREKKEAKEDQRISESAVVLKEIIGVPEGIPKICSTKPCAWWCIPL